MSEQSMIDALRKLRESKFRNKTAQMRDLYDEVEALRACGVSHKLIIAAMKEHGLIFNDVRTFEVIFYRIKKERSVGRATTGASESSNPVETITDQPKTLSTLKNAKTIPQLARPTESSNDEARNKLRQSGGLKQTEYNRIPDRKPEF